MHADSFHKNDEVEVSVVMPCLNEAETIGICIEKAKSALLQNNINGEVIVSDNGSTDGSVHIALSLGAKVVHQPQRGYGNAYIKGINSAKGKFIVIGDADNTYDFSQVDKFVEPLRKGADMVMGSRLKGRIHKGAMPFLHRYVGNPLLSGILNLMFKAKVSDTHCGMRSFKKEVFDKLCLKTPGMEFASEMIIKSAKAKIKIVDIPITYYPRKGESKLRTFKDGWRHLRFMLLLSPEYLFIIPGVLMSIFGLVTIIILVNGPVILFNHNFDIHMMILSSFFTISGMQILFLGIFTQVYSDNLFLVSNKLLARFNRYITLGKGVYVSFLLLFIGLVFCLRVFYNYIHSILGNSVYYNARLAIFGITMLICGFQILFSSFYIRFMEIRKEHEDFKQ
ncbi:MAG: glycosyltransferase family 2 protein [Candidatus Omnitrophica bacterium]|nr:glycosyltransferase family 2 protein [Candidatus Omnitrophota bacterium]